MGMSKVCESNSHDLVLSKSYINAVFVIYCWTQLSQGDISWFPYRKTSESPNQIIQRWSRQTGDKCARETKRKMNTIRLHSDVVQLPKTLHCNVTYMLHDAGLTSLLHQRLSHLVKKGFPILGSERGETQLGL
ncbi:hypothetical protein KC19_10G113100 [Ceratodon purpureus]|uniref:Uncharacterized protein n=1 Tax=Ceratodon purpureus TaxID=3225 RepID=A0A8T0GKK2_CERPU|nr:hypothetical protein KC19_10G113100 [Ceratodon purpureus]